MTGLSQLIGVGLSVSCAIILRGYMQQGIIRWEYLLGTVVFLVDSAARYHRLLKGEDDVPPGFLEWLLRPRKKYE